MNNVVLLGEGSLFWEIKDFLANHPVQVFTLDQKFPSFIRAVIDSEIEDEKKKEGLLKVEGFIEEDVPIYTSALHRTSTEIASWLQHSERVIGFSPLLFDRMNRLEVSLPLQYDEERITPHLLFWKEMEKEVEIVGDEPGFVFPRMLALLVNEASFALSEGISTKEEIDLAMKKGTSFPVGPLEWADDIGIDIILSILDGLYRELGEEKYRPSPLLKKMYYAGYLGQVAGRGFYSYQRTSSLIEW